MKPLMFIVPLVLLGALAGLAFSGIINIPGISPQKKKAKAAALYAETRDEKPAAPGRMALKTPTPKPKEKEAPETAVAVSESSPESGERKLAKLWDEVDPAALGQIVKDWKDDELAKVLLRMDATKAAELLAVMEPSRASRLSSALKREASVVPPAAKPN